MPYRDNWECLCKMMLNLFSSRSIDLGSIECRKKMCCLKVKCGLVGDYHLSLCTERWLYNYLPSLFQLSNFFKSSTRNSVENGACLGKLGGWAKGWTLGDWKHEKIDQSSVGHGGTKVKPHPSLYRHSAYSGLRWQSTWSTHACFDIEWNRQKSG